MDGITFWLTATFAAFCVGLSKGGVPVISAMAVPMMSLVMSPILAAGLLLPVYIAADMGGLYAYRHKFNARVFKIMAAAMPVGVFIGWLTSSYVSEAAVTIIIGLIGGSFAVNMILRKPITGDPVAARVKPGLFWGTITGFTSFVSHSGATPYQIYTLPLRMDKITFAGTVTVTFAYINIVKLIPYYALGQLSAEIADLVDQADLGRVCAALSVVSVFIHNWGIALERLTGSHQACRPIRARCGDGPTAGFF